MTGRRLALTRRRIATSVLLACLLSTIPLGVAQAHDPVLPRGPQQPAAGRHAASPTTANLLPISTSTSTVGALAAFPNPYGCTGQSMNPHMSGHVPNTVNAEGKTWCPYPGQPWEFVGATLYKEDCFFGACWWTQEDYKSATTTNGTAADVFVNHTCGDSTTHVYEIDTFSEILGRNGTYYYAWTSNSASLPCN